MIKLLLVLLLIFSGCSFTYINKKDEKEFKKWHRKFREYNQEPHEWAHEPHK